VLLNQGVLVVLLLGVWVELAVDSEVVHAREVEHQICLPTLLPQAEAASLLVLMGSLGCVGVGRTVALLRLLHQAVVVLVERRSRQHHGVTRLPREGMREALEASGLIHSLVALVSLHVVLVVAHGEVASEVHSPVLIKVSKEVWVLLEQELWLVLAERGPVILEWTLDVEVLQGLVAVVVFLVQSVSIRLHIETVRVVVGGLLIVGGQVHRWVEVRALAVRLVVGAAHQLLL
jgi:hypothetical protein